MEREIKFRGYSVFNQSWVCGSLIRSLYEADKIRTMLGIDFEVDIQSIGQFLGIRDVNGKAVYEGDILKMNEYENAFLLTFDKEVDPLDFSHDECKGKLKESYITSIRFCDGEFVFVDESGCDTSLSVLCGDMRLSSPLFEFEVIGNVYEHPELLKWCAVC